MDNSTDAEKVWQNLKKEYLTLEQKLDIIREHNITLNDKHWDDTLESLKQFLQDRQDLK